MRHLPPDSRSETLRRSFLIRFGTDEPLDLSSAVINFKLIARSGKICLNDFHSDYKWFRPWFATLPVLAATES